MAVEKIFFEYQQDLLIQAARKGAEGASLLDQAMRLRSSQLSGDGVTGVDQVINQGLSRLQEVPEIVGQFKAVGELLPEALRMFREVGVEPPGEEYLSRLAQEYAPAPQLPKQPTSVEQVVVEFPSIVEKPEPPLGSINFAKAPPTEDRFDLKTNGEQEAEGVVVDVLEEADVDLGVAQVEVDVAATPQEEDITLASESESESESVVSSEQTSAVLKKKPKNALSDKQKQTAILMLEVDLKEGRFRNATLAEIAKKLYGLDPDKDKATINSRGGAVSIFRDNVVSKIKAAKSEGVSDESQEELLDFARKEMDNSELTLDDVIELLNRRKKLADFKKKS